MKRRNKGMKKWNLRTQFKDRTIRRSEDASILSADLEGGNSMSTGGSKGSIRSVRMSSGRRH